MLLLYENIFISKVLPTIFCALSLFSSVSLLATYQKIMRMRMGPGKVTFMINICELLMTMLWIGSFYYSDSSSDAPSAISPVLCFFLGMIEVFIYSSYLLLHIGFIHSLRNILLLKDKNPSESFKKYLTVSLLGAIACTLAAVIPGGIDHTPYGFCGAKGTSIIQILSFVFAVVVNPFILLTLWNIHKRKGQQGYGQEEAFDIYTRDMKRYFFRTNIGFSLVFVLAWYPFHVVNIIFFLQANEGATMGFYVFALIAFYLICLTSFFMMIVRMRDPMLKKMVYHFIRSTSSVKGSDHLTGPTQDLSTSLLFSEQNDRSKRTTMSKHGSTKDVVVSYSMVQANSKPQKVEEEIKKSLTNEKLKRSKTSTTIKPITLDGYRSILYYLEQLLETAPSGSEAPGCTERLPWASYFYTQLSSVKLKSLGDDTEGTANGFIHAAKVFEHLGEQFGYSFSEIAHSINLVLNEKNLEDNFEKFATKATGFFKNYHFSSFDKEIQFQIIDKDQKFSLVENYLQPYHSFVASETGNLLPQLLGLYTVDDSASKHIILLLKNRYKKFLKGKSGSRLIMKHRTVVDADYIRFEVLDQDGTVQSRTKAKIETENMTKLPVTQKVIPMSPEDRTRLIEIIRKNLKFLDKTEITGYKVIFIISSAEALKAWGDSKRQSTDDGEFLRNLRTIDGDKIDAFIELKSYARANKLKQSDAGAAFSKETPKIYRQCIDETLYQLL